MCIKSAVNVNRKCKLYLIFHQKKFEKLFLVPIWASMQENLILVDASNNGED